MKRPTPSLAKAAVHATGRDAVYYVRAIEAPSLAVDADPLGCSYDESGRCVEVDPCFFRADEDECLSETEERAWSSPIFVDYRPRQQIAGPSEPSRL